MNKNSFAVFPLVVQILSQCVLPIIIKFNIDDSHSALIINTEETVINRNTDREK